MIITTVESGGLFLSGVSRQTHINLPQKNYFFLIFRLFKRLLLFIDIFFFYIKKLLSVNKQWIVDVKKKKNK